MSDLPEQLRNLPFVAFVAADCPADVSLAVTGSGITLIDESPATISPVSSNNVSDIASWLESYTTFALFKRLADAGHPGLVVEISPRSKSPCTQMVATVPVNRGGAPDPGVAFCAMASESGFLVAFLMDDKGNAWYLGSGPIDASHWEAMPPVRDRYLSWLYDQPSAGEHLFAFRIDADAWQSINSILPRLTTDTDVHGLRTPRGDGASPGFLLVRSLVSALKNKSYSSCYTAFAVTYRDGALQIQRRL